MYMPESLKQSTRKKRRQRRKVTETTPLLRNWQLLLQVDSKKAEHFECLVNHLSEETPPEGRDLTTVDAAVKCTNQGRVRFKLEPCTHAQEVDTWIMILCSSRLSENIYIIRTIDTDVPVLTVSLYTAELCFVLWTFHSLG